MNRIHRTQFDHERLDHECFDYLSRELTQSTVLEQKRFDLRSLSPALPNLCLLVLFEPGKYLWELSPCVPYIGIPCRCIRFDMLNAADTNSLNRRSEDIITVYKNILHVQSLRYFERK